LAVLEQVAAGRCCELEVAATLNSDGGAQGLRTCKALGWQVHAEDHWVDRAMAVLKVKTRDKRHQGEEVYG